LGDKDLLRTLLINYFLDFVFFAGAAGTAFFFTPINVRSPRHHAAASALMILSAPDTPVEGFANPPAARSAGARVNSSRQRKLVSKKGKNVRLFILLGFGSLFGFLFFLFTFILLLFLNFQINQYGN